MPHLPRLALLALALLPIAAPAQKRPHPPTRDLFAFHWIGDFQVSPSGASAVYVEATTTPDHSGYQTSLYLLDLAIPNATPQRLTEGPHDSSPRFSPDGKQLAFVRSPERSAAAAATPTPAQVYVMPATIGGTIIKLTDLPRGAGSPLWSPNGQAILVTSSTPQDQAKSRLEAAKRARATGDEAHVSDIHIINRASWRFNGAGYLDPTMVPPALPRLPALVHRRTSPSLATNRWPLRSLRPPLVSRLLLGLLHLHPRRRARLRRVPPQYPLRHPGHHSLYPP